MLLAAIVLQLLLKGTIAVEHRVASHFKGKAGGWMEGLRFFCAWLVLFGSKFVILEALDFRLRRQRAASRASSTGSSG